MHSFKDDTFHISVRELVEFIFKSGDISSRKGTRRELSMLAGTRIHQKIQKRQSSLYKAEVPYAATIPVKLESDEVDYNIVIDGRADGVFEEDGLPAIDEIKGIYRNLNNLLEPEPVHLAQATCYAYMDGIENKSAHIIRMTYVNLDTEEEKYFYKTMEWSELESWFTNLIEEYKKWCTFLYKHRKKRNESISELKFPYDFRPGQKGLIATAYKYLTTSKILYIQASTGIGKTLSTVFPAFKTMGDGHGERIFYLTAKTITSSVAKEAMSILQNAGLKATYVALTAKEKLCFMDEMNCDPETCPYAKGHQDRVNAAVYSLITSKETINREDILECAAEHMVCPFELSLDVTYWIDLIICDYNYVFDPNVKLQRFFSGTSSDSLFLIDEAHNLVDRAREMISATLYKKDFLEAKKIITPFSKRLKNAIEGCNKELLALKRECDEFTPYENMATLYRLFDRLETLMEAFASFYENNPNFYDKDISSFFFECRDFVNLRPDIERGYVAYGSLTDSEDYSVTLANVDPASYLKGCLDKGVGTVLFSATLLPINYYRSLLTGEHEDNAIYAESPFDTSKRLLLIGSDVTSKYSSRGREQYLRVVEYIREISGSKAGHYIVYFPSYSYMKQVYDLAEDMHEHILMQEQFMNEEERENYLEAFENDENELLIGFCVLGGIFSEGIDLRGSALIGVIVVGTGLPGVSSERNLIKDYFNEREQDGFAYSYLYPGIGRILQAAGRLIRTEDDKGIIALLDDRFQRYEYKALFPREWKDAVRTNINIVKEQISEFWEKM